MPNSDSVELRVAGQVVKNFESYTIDADLYTADDAFIMELADPAAPIKPGSRCEVQVNGAVELAGVIDRVAKRYDKKGTVLTVSGRDLMGILVDSYAEDWVDIEGKKVKELAEMMVGKTARHPALPFISRERIVYQENFVGKGKGKKQTVSQPFAGFLDTAQKISHIEPGMTVFEVLKNYAMSRGLMFWLEYWPDGPRFVFGRPVAGGAAAFFLCCQKDGKGNNVSEGELADDISKRYSRITVVTQQQGQDDFGMNAGKVNQKSVREDKEFPFYKPFVTRLTNDSQSPALHARLLQEKQRHDGFQLTYKVAGHNQAGLNWAINRICQVRDEVLDVDGPHLIFGRTFERTKSGTFTTLRLGLPGLVA